MKLNKVLELLKDDKYQATVTRPNNHDYRINITKVVRTCFHCRIERNINDLHVRQDDRVTMLLIPKLFCSTCTIEVDRIKAMLKPSIPRHLKRYTTK